MKLKLLVIVVLLVAGGAAIFVSLGGLPAQGSAGSAYLTASATTGDVSEEVAATGTVAADASYALGFGADPQPVTDTTTSVGQGTWQVASVTAEVGKSVKKGAVLATADTADLKVQLANAENTLRNTRTQETIAKENLDAASGTDALRQTRIAWRNAINERRKATQDRDDLKQQIALAKLVAPIDGIVTAVNITKGLESTGTAITIASSTFEVTADVVESDVSSMSVGQTATITVDAIEATIQGTVSAIAPVASSSSGSNSSSVVSYPVTVTLTGAPSALRSGMTADITIVTASASNVLTVPSEALRGSAGSYRVQVMGADGSLTSTPVTVGLVTSTTAEIKSGLTAGDVVVTGTSAARTGTTTTTGGGGLGGGFSGGNLPGGGFQRP